MFLSLCKLWRIPFWGHSTSNPTEKGGIRSGGLWTGESASSWGCPSIRLASSQLLDLQNAGPYKAGKLFVSWAQTSARSGIGGQLCCERGDFQGRTSSQALSAILRRVNAICAATALYMTLPCVPTRWNPSDDPTRGVPLRPRYGSLSLDDWEEDDLYKLLELPSLCGFVW